MEKKKPAENWRQLNMQRAREARMLKIREKKDKEIIKKIDNLALTVDDKVEKEIEEKVNRMIKEADTDKIKSDFLKVFYEVGGIKGMVQWIKKNIKNRTEYYKLLTGLLKSESQKPQQTQGQQVILNIITPDKKEEYIINGEHRAEQENN